MFATIMTSTTIFDYNGELHYARSYPFSQIRSHIIRTVVRIVGMGHMSHICNTKYSRL